MMHLALLQYILVVVLVVLVPLVLLALPALVVPVLTVAVLLLMITTGDGVLSRGAIPTYKRVRLRGLLRMRAGGPILLEAAATGAGGHRV